MKKPVVLALALVLITSACNIPIVVIPAGTPQVVVITATPEATVAPSASPSPTLTPTQTPIPTSSIPLFTVDIGANCRSGPSTDYNVLTGIPQGTSVRILGISSPERVLWWFVAANGTLCWVSGSLGTTSGTFAGIPVVYAPPLPTPTPKSVAVTFENDTGGAICKLDLYVGITVVRSFSWGPKQFKTGGEKAVTVPIGHYDLVEAYNCKPAPKLVGTLTDIIIDAKNNIYALSLP